MKKSIITVIFFLLLPSLSSAEIKINSRIFYDDGAVANKLDSLVQNELVIKKSATDGNFAALRSVTIDITKKIADTFKGRSSECVYTVVGIFEDKKLGNLTPIYTFSPSNYSVPTIEAYKKKNARLELHNSCTNDFTAVVTKSVYQSFETVTFPTGAAGTTGNYSKGTSTNYCYGVFGKKIVGDGSCSKDYADYLPIFASSIQAMFESAIIDAEKNK